MSQFRKRASESFLTAYFGVLDVAPRRWVSEAAQTPLLDLFLLEKAAYEIRYEATNRPGWIGIPLDGAARIASRLIGDLHAHD